MEQVKKERQSGIELLRIVAIFFVVWLHYCDRLLPLENGMGGYNAGVQKFKFLCC